VSLPPIDMTGKVALVTGGGYGMGRASARLFARAGAQVVVADIDADRGKETIGLIEADGGSGLFVEADVSLSADVRRTISAVDESFGRLDYAHNNAGILEGQDKLADYAEEQWDRLIANNLTSVFLCMKYEIPLMARGGGGAIVNVASEATYKGNIADVGYTASKHGVYGLTTAAGLTYLDQNIRVNAVAPGNIDTGIIERARAAGQAEAVEWAAGVQPIRRLGRPEEIAEVVLWLCSDAASFVNASRIAADTGWHVS